MISVAPSFPIPAPPGTPPWINVLFALAAIAGFAVIVWQAVSYFRRDDHRGDGPRDDERRS